MRFNEQLTGTSACLLRDGLMKAWFRKAITLSEITSKLSGYDLPDWLQTEILQMESFNKLNRFTCPIEQAMVSAVYIKIVDQLIQDDKNICFNSSFDHFVT